MAVDPSDTLEPPYGLGECVEDADLVEVHCKTMFDEGYLITAIPMRRRGDFVQIILHEIFYYPKSTESELITFKLPDEDSWLGKNRVSRRFACVGFNGCARNTDNMTNEICICQIDIDAEGNVYIAPKGHNEGFTTSIDPIGICATTISFLVDDSETQEEEEKEEEEETEEPETKIIKLG